VVSYSYIFWAYGMTTVMAFNGAGDIWTPTKINFFIFWLLQIPLASYLTRTELGLLGVFWAVAISQSVLAVVGVLWFRRGRWKEQKV
jgi:Na+-driven multidrug efflux pump